jgi:hypothetical protein
MPFVSSVEGSLGYGRAARPAAGGDQIAASLTTSLAAYNAASAGSWVKITITEYTNLQTNVTETSVAGLATANLNTINSTNFTSGGLSFCNISSANTPSIAANQFVYAFAVYVGGTALSDIRVYANNSTTLYTNFTQLGGILPATSPINSRNYYVLKGVAAVTAATAGLLAASTANVLPMGFSQTAGGTGVRFVSTQPLITSTTLNSSFTNGSSAFGIQCLTTGTKQW